MATKTETDNGEKLNDKNTSDTGSNIDTISLTSSEKGEGKYPQNNIDTDRLIIVRFALRLQDRCRTVIRLLCGSSR